MTPFINRQLSLMIKVILLKLHPNLGVVALISTNSYIRQKIKSMSKSLSKLLCKTRIKMFKKIFFELLLYNFSLMDSLNLIDLEIKREKSKIEDILSRRS